MYLDVPESFAWLPFAALCLALVSVRLSVRPLLPLNVLSTWDAVGLGFGLFFTTSLLGYREYLAIDEFAFMGLVVLAYAVFLAGVIGTRCLIGLPRSVRTLHANRYRYASYAGAFVVAGTIGAVGRYLATGGPAKTVAVVTGGLAHGALVDQISAGLVTGPQGLTLFGLASRLFETALAAFWVPWFVRRPILGTTTWFAYLVTTTDVYFSRSALLGLAVLPLLAYLACGQHQRLRLAAVGTAVAAALVFFSWNAAIRLGLPYELSARRVVSDGIRDAGTSGVQATYLAAGSRRGSGSTYLASLVSFPIPRSMWRAKPTVQFNLEATEVLSGRSVGAGTSVITSTILGEAWYYFGLWRALPVVFAFGVMAYSLHWLLVRHVLLIGPFLLLVYQAFVQVRSTMLGFVQAGVVVLILAYAVVFCFEVLVVGPTTRRRSRV